MAWRPLGIGLTVGALALTACGDDGSTTALPAAVSPTTAAAKTTSPASGTVSVTVSKLTGRVGSKVAAILYRGRPSAVDGIVGFAAVDGLAGFAASVTADPFSVSEFLRVGNPLWGEAPGGVAQLPIGSHTLIVHVSSDLGPYSGWVAAEPVEAWCYLVVQVFSGEETAVRVSDVPPREPATAPPVDCPVG